MQRPAACGTAARSSSWGLPPKHQAAVVIMQACPPGCLHAAAARHDSDMLCMPPRAPQMAWLPHSGGAGKMAVGPAEHVLLLLSNATCKHHLAHERCSPWLQVPFEPCAPPSPHVLAPPSYAQHLARSCPSASTPHSSSTQPPSSPEPDALVLHGAPDRSSRHARRAGAPRTPPVNEATCSDGPSIRGQ